MPRGGQPRGGHIPGARNIPFDSVVEDSNKFKSVETLRQLFNPMAGLLEDFGNLNARNEALLSGRQPNHH
jgi:3-mercaptopyruvate sulfurtransferase SseA